MALKIQWARCVFGKGYGTMKRFVFAFIVFASICGLAAQAQMTGGSQEKKKPGEWWRSQYYTRPLNSPDGKKLPLIAVRGNRFVDPDGKTLVFRGVNIADPDKIDGQGHWSKDLFVKVKESGATVVRIPVHPAAWRGRGTANYLVLLDQAVQWSTDLGMYVDIDWHSIGNLKEGVFQDPIYETSLPETLNFWRTMAAHFNGNNTVAFFELFNEPSISGGKFGSMTWDDWRGINEEMITLIRAYDRDTIPLVAGLDWAYDLAPLRDSPVRADGIGYVTHPYPNKRKMPWEAKWEEDFGFASARYPMIATEVGFSEEYGSKADNDAYANDLTKYLDSKGIGWIVWCFDPQWGPTMIKSWDTYEYTAAGTFFSGEMKAKGSAPAGQAK